MPGTDTLYSQFDIKRKYDSPNSYGVQQSWYGDGKYPPDWGARREAIWEEQNYWCGRCGRYKGDVNKGVCHHIRHLSDGGSNHLDNLVGLCSDCHSIMHPDNPEVSGAVENAPVFPDATANDRVAVVHTHGIHRNLKADLQRLAETESPEKNTRALTSVCEPITAEQAKSVDGDTDKLAETLKQRGLVPLSKPHNRLYISTTIAGVKGVLSPAEPKVETVADAEVSEVVESEQDGYETALFTTPGTCDVNITTSCRGTPATETNIELTPQQRIKGYQAAIEGPELTLRTVPHYLWGIAKHLGTKSLVTLPLGFLLSLFSLNPLGGSTGAMLIVSFILSVFWLGLELLVNYDSEPSERVDEQVDPDSD